MSVRTFRLLELNDGDFTAADVDIAVDDLADIRWVSVTDLAALTTVGTLTAGATGAGFTIALTTSTVTGTLPAANMPALTGDITTSAGAVATTIAANAVTLAKMATMTPNTILGNATIGMAAPQVLSASTVKTLLAIANTDVSGLGTLATQSGTFSGTSSGTNTGDQSSVATLTTPRLINGVSFNGSADITVTAAGSTLTGSTIAAGMLGTSGATACAGNDSRLSDARTPTSHASSHLGDDDPTTLISYVVRQLIVKDEPLTIDSGIVVVVGADNTALVWCDAMAAVLMSPVNTVIRQILIKDEPFVVESNAVTVIGSDPTASLWCDSNTWWDRDNFGFETMLDLNADNLFKLDTNEVLDIRSRSPIARHLDSAAADTGALWIR